MNVGSNTTVSIFKNILPNSKKKIRYSAIFVLNLALSLVYFIKKQQLFGLNEIFVAFPYGH